MPGNNRSIGGAGLEQGGPNLGNDYSRDISREMVADDSDIPVTPHPEQPGGHKHKNNEKEQQNKLKKEGLNISEEEQKPNHNQPR